MDVMAFLGWLMLFTIFGAAGYALAVYRGRMELERLRTLRQVLEADWAALDGVRRVRGVYDEARRELRRQDYRPPAKARPVANPRNGVR